ncbi:hypothetical protein IFR05_006022 [Cadophora sp. M221]|nr:hypothetical protein IFR05_006022 [Cadophora sp. M221]
MAEVNDSSAAASGPTSNLPSHFNKLSHIYPRQTGNSTLNLFASIADHLAPISATSIIHDNASGPGTATSVILKSLKPEDYPSVIATDMVPAMIDAFNSDIAEVNGSSKLTGIVMKSEFLDFPDQHFTHSITNFSIFNFADPLVCVKEIYRTLKPSGQAVITTWKTFAIGDVIHETQRRIRPDLPIMKVSGVEYHKSNAIIDIMVQAGFERERVRLLSPAVVVGGNDLEGLIEFGSGPFTDAARAGWTDEEKGSWKEVLREVLDEKKREFAMSFKLTEEHVRSFLNPASGGDWAPFLSAIDPDVVWTIGSPKEDMTCCTGVFNLQGWLDKVAPLLQVKLEGALQMNVESLDIIGNKAVVEASGFATQKNGNTYENNYCWIMTFDDESGKAVVIKEYMNTALVKEVIATNPM